MDLSSSSANVMQNTDCAEEIEILDTVLQLPPRIIRSHRSRRSGHESSLDREREDEGEWDRERDREWNEERINRRRARSGRSLGPQRMMRSRWEPHGSSNNYMEDDSFDGPNYDCRPSTSSAKDMHDMAQVSALHHMQQLEVIQQQQHQLERQQMELHQQQLMQKQQQSQQWGAMYPMGDPTSMMVPTTMAFNQFSFLGSTDAAPDPVPLMSITQTIKDIIHCKSCTLFPPTNSVAEDISMAERPPGCRTVFVGGIPENADDAIIREIFERCGEITNIRTCRPRKNFCHIRFAEEICVDNAIYLSGYRVRIGSNTDEKNNGRVHVYYAQARDDFYEWECRQRALEREQRHRERRRFAVARPPSPRPVVHFSEHVAVTLADNLKAIPNASYEDGCSDVRDNNFFRAFRTLATWLDRGDCVKRNSAQFFGMIQSTNTHIRRLASEKSHLEEEFHRAKQKLREEINGILIQFNLIEKVFMAASHQKVWDHFTKAQRRSIDMWKQQAQAIKEVHLEDAIKERVEDEMDFSDDDDGAPNKKSKDDEDTHRADAAAALEQKVNSLQEENDSMRCQLEAYTNEMEILKLEHRQESDEKDKQTHSLQQALQGMQQQLIQVNQNKKKDEEELNELKKNMGDKQPVTASSSEKEVPTSSYVTTPKSSSGVIPPQGIATENEAKMIGLIATFLHVHPFGASIDYIWSYLQRFDRDLQPSDVEALLVKFTSVFKKEMSGVGASLERKWRFTGFDM